MQEKGVKGRSLPSLTWVAGQTRKTKDACNCRQENRLPPLNPRVQACRGGVGREPECGTPEQGTHNFEGPHAQSRLMLGVQGRWVMFAIRGTKVQEATALSKEREGGESARGYILRRQCLVVTPEGNGAVCTHFRPVPDDPS